MSSYKNPFTDYNSNTMTSQQIYDLFAEPYELVNFPKESIVDDKSAIIFIGGRASGKTMLLRQFSYNVQKIDLEAESNYYDKVKKDKYIGIYFRVDTPLLRRIDDFYSIQNQDIVANNIFSHYFELTVFKEYLEVITILIKDAKITKQDPICLEILNSLKNLFPCEIDIKIQSVDSLLNFIISQINYIWKYQSDKAIDIENNVQFTPACGLLLQGSLTNKFVEENILKLFGLSETKILLLIDEFESFSENQQKILNTALRFTNSNGVRFRIGMRPFGFKTYHTINSEDFIKEGRDYTKIEFISSLLKKENSKLYANLLKKIANKRLDTHVDFKGKCIEDILGKSEDLELEASEIVNKKKKHILVYLKIINKIRKPSKMTELTEADLIEIYDENPLYEMECLLLLVRKNELNFVIKALNDFKNNIDSEESRKFKNDYEGKYKLSFIFILCSIYKKEKKKYYSFKDYSYLSSGVIGVFIALCRKAFELEYFRDSEKLLKGEISNKTQTDAAYSFAYSEREMIQRISEYGRRLEVFIDNLGNSFSFIHKDFQLRYPETNQFSVHLESLSKENQTLIEQACKWLLLIKKPNNQDVHGENKQLDTFILNRVFSPIFNISYRTRGGFNPVKMSDEYFSSDFNPKKLLLETNDKTNAIEQNTLF